MRALADRQRIEAFLSTFARSADRDVDVYLVGGTSAVLVGWRASTKDIDLVMRPKSDAMLRAIAQLKNTLDINVELASPHQFIPVATGWEARSPVIGRIERVTFHHYDFTAQALAKIERGHVRDLDDVQAMLERGLITVTKLRAQFAETEAQLYRYPAIDPAEFRRALEAITTGK